MADEAKKAIEEMAKSVDGNLVAQAFLDGVKHGLKYGKINKEE